MLRIEYVFTIFFLALGPLTVIPAFYKATQHADRAYQIRAALLATLIAALVIAVVALFGAGTLQGWHVSVAALDITIGILLLRSTFTTLSRLESVMEHVGDGEQPPPSKPVPVAALAFSPIAVPTIVSPIAVVTIALFLSLAQSNTVLTHQIYLVMVLMLVLNCIGMLFAGFVIRFVRLPTLAVAGWIFAALQATLAVEVVLNGLRLVGVIPR